MRISLSGTYSTGKTTLAETCAPALAKRLGNEFAYIREVARTVIDRGFSLDRAATTDSYVVYIQLQLAAERAVAGVPHVLSDRSLMDLLAYIRFNDPDLVPGHVRAMLEEVVWLERERFDVYAYLPVEFPLEDDGVRTPDETYRTAIDESLRSVFDDFGVSVETIRGSVQARAGALMKLFGVTP